MSASASTTPPAQPAGAARPHRFVRRFDRWNRSLHLGLMISFLGLAGTGLPLLFSGTRWAWYVSRMWGGYVAAGVLHRIFAIALFVVFGLHLARLAHRIFVERQYSILWGPGSLVPQPRDFHEMIAHFRWFLGRGPRPVFDRYTYWEKFDYWAVFWGMLIIGGSGLMLWFPRFFTMFLPGWVLNIALLVHGEEALLAVGFIFTIHFFNGHLRPEKFPMDLVIFTGRVPAEEFVHERPAEYERLVAEGRFDEQLTRPPTRREILIGRTIGTIAVSLGVLWIVLIVFAVFGH